MKNIDVFLSYSIWILDSEKHFKHFIFAVSFYLANIQQKTATSLLNVTFLEVELNCCYSTCTGVISTVKGHIVSISVEKYVKELWENRVALKKNVRSCQTSLHVIRNNRCVQCFSNFLKILIVFVTTVVQFKSCV